MYICKKTPLVYTIIVYVLPVDCEIQVIMAGVRPEGLTTTKLLVNDWMCITDEYFGIFDHR